MQSTSSHALLVVFIVGGDNRDPVTVQLKATGTIRGRLVNELGDPLSGAEVVAKTFTSDDAILGNTFWWAETDADGRFQITGILADCDFRLDARLDAGASKWIDSGRIQVTPGEDKDVGTFRSANKFKFSRIPANNS